MDKKAKLLSGFTLCCVLGIGIGIAAREYYADVLNWSPFKPALYESKDQSLIAQYSTQEPIDLLWSQLLPEKELAVIQQYQQQPANSALDFADNILRSIEAASDKSYATAMVSTNTIDSFDEQAITISAFIVPLDHHASQRPNNIFLVPYFGACIHFPPPPPNQIIYAQLQDAFDDFELTQAYKISGILKRGLFEDPMGTSAYIMEVVSIEPFFEDPDDLRLH